MLFFMEIYTTVQAQLRDSLCYYTDTCQTVCALQVLGVGTFPL